MGVPVTSTFEPSTGVANIRVADSPWEGNLAYLESLLRNDVFETYVVYYT